MAITADQLLEAAQIVGNSPNVRAAATLLRERFAPLRTLIVDALDMHGETPAIQLEQRSIYLMSTDGHCWTVTREPQTASAFLLTQD